jgi:protein TonB
MNHYILFSILLFSVFNSFSQDTIQRKNTEVYALISIDKKPEFPGGQGEFYKYIGTNYKMPNIKNLNGKVLVTFVIEKDGSIVEVKVLRDLGYGTGEEAIRVLKASPKWVPGEQNGQPVRVHFALPIALKN